MVSSWITDQSGCWKKRSKRLEPNAEQRQPARERQALPSSDITKSSLKQKQQRKKSKHTTQQQQMGQKRPRSDTMEAPSAQQSPFLPMFETFRAELDEHHDRRERTIKASRDITAASKKMSVS
jgi:hypothetical protein